MGIGTCMSRFAVTIPKDIEISHITYPSVPEAVIKYTLKWVGLYSHVTYEIVIAAARFGLSRTGGGGREGERKVRE